MTVMEVQNAVTSSKKNCMLGYLQVSTCRTTSTLSAKDVSIWTRSSSRRQEMCSTVTQVDHVLWSCWSLVGSFHVTDNLLLFVNVGDSRAILSRKRGEITICSYDHKPQFFGEMQRIFKYGGQLYRVCNNKATMETEIYHASTHHDFAQIDRIPEESDERIFGPWRVKPGGLSVLFWPYLGFEIIWRYWKQIQRVWRVS